MAEKTLNAEGDLDWEEINQILDGTASEQFEDLLNLYRERNS